MAARRQVVWQAVRVGYHWQDGRREVIRETFENVHEALAQVSRYRRWGWPTWCERAVAVRS
jgi:hypothetical protein